MDRAEKPVIKKLICDLLEPFFQQHYQYAVRRLYFIKLKN